MRALGPSAWRRPTGAPPSCSSRAPPSPVRAGACLELADPPGRVEVRTAAVGSSPGDQPSDLVLAHPSYDAGEGVLDARRYEEAVLWSAPTRPAAPRAPALVDNCYW